MRWGYFQRKDNPKNPTGKPRFTVNTGSSQTLTLLWEDTQTSVAENQQAIYDQQIASSASGQQDYYKDAAEYWCNYLTFAGPLRGTDSGDEACVMRYYFAIAYEAKGKTNTFYVMRPGVKQPEDQPVQGPQGHGRQCRFPSAAIALRRRRRRTRRLLCHHLSERRHTAQEHCDPMNLRHFTVPILPAALLLIAAGCSKKAPEAKPAPQSVAQAPQPAAKPAPAVQTPPAVKPVPKPKPALPPPAPEPEPEPAPEILFSLRGTRDGQLANDRPLFVGVRIELSGDSSKTLALRRRAAVGATP